MMDFMSALPKTRSRNEMVWVIVDRLTKSTHFIPLRVGCTMDTMAQKYIQEIVRLHCVLLTIVSDRDLVL